jgi:U3 small nucleolar RNA-associated protein 13
MKDYKNAIHLALQMNHPRRLLQLFSTVAAQRPEGDASQSVGALLESALRGSSARAMMADTVLRQAGVLPPGKKASALNGHGQKGNDGSAERQRDRESITGLYAVDRIIATLPALQLVQLLHHVRDWNTSTRTSDIAQTILHAILRLHTAEHILDAFDQVQNQKQANALPVGKHARIMDVGTLLDSLVPYSERHYNRADRLLTEAAMLDFTLNSMSALFGDDERNEQDDADRGHVNGSSVANGMAVDEESSSDDEDEDTDMED